MSATTRFSNQAIRLTMALAFALLLAGSMAHRAGATEMDKGAFKTGCESGGNSYVENADGSFQCNLRAGGTIKCSDTKSPCTYTANLRARLKDVSFAGAVQMMGTSDPALTATPIVKQTGSISNTKAQFSAVSTPTS